VKGELLDSRDNMVRDRASTFVLGLAGIAPAAAPSLNVNLEIRAGYIIDISPEPGERADVGMRIVSPTTPCAAIEHDE
jgi:hypothetical protein